MRIKSIIIMSSFMFFVGCASVPREIIIAQDKLGTSIDKAERNQATLINQYAADAKKIEKSRLDAALPQVLKKKFGENKPLSLEDVALVIKDYSNDLEAAYSKIDNKKDELLQSTNDFFSNMRELNYLNKRYLSSLYKLNESYKQSFSTIPEFSGKLDSLVNNAKEIKNGNVQ